MSKKGLFGSAVLIIGILLIFSLIGCDGLNNENNDNDGWPPSSELNKFLLGGWDQPVGLSGINWGYTLNTTDMLFMQIQFTTASSETAADIRNSITSLGYTNDLPGGVIDDGPVHYHSVFEKEDAVYEYAVNYTFDVPGGGGIQLLREKKGGGSGGPVLPSSFTITDCTLPVGSLVYATEENPDTVLTWGSSPGMGPAESSGAGVLQSNKTVAWNLGKTPPDDTYTIIMGSMGDGTFYKATDVQITSGGGSVDWDAFSLLSML